ncbi:MAG TPA: hypothetical protein VJS66_05480 [Burkholderiales bacterium]|nr:hypothetical protein [Burkholderiales bacterium]
MSVNQDYRYRSLAGVILLVTSILVFAVVYFLLAVHADIPLLDGDDAVYVLMADYFSPFSERSSAITELVMRHSRFPPFYPLVLGMLGVDSSHLAAMHAVTVAFLLGAMAMLFLWARQVSESAVWAALAAMLFGLLPVTVHQSFGILSENLYLLLSLLAIWCTVRDRRDERWLIITAIVIALACFSRSLGFALLLAWLICLRQVPLLERIRLGLIALMPTFVWNIWKLAHGYHGDYSDSLLDGLRGGMLSDLLQVHARAPWLSLWNGWITSFDADPSIVTLVVGSVVGMMCLVGTLYRATQWKVDGVYVIVYLLVILVWPYTYEARRFLYPVLPVLLVHGCLWLTALPHKRIDLRMAAAYPYVYLAIMALIAFPAVATMAERFMQSRTSGEHMYALSPSWYGYGNREEARTRAAEQMALVRAWRDLKNIVREGQCVYHVKPVALMLYADRPSYVPPLVGEENYGDLLQRASQCRYFYLGAYTYYPYLSPFYPQRYLSDSRVVQTHYLEGPGDRRVLGYLVEPRRDTVPIKPNKE